MLFKLQFAQILQVRRLCLSQARSLSRCTRLFTVSAQTAMTQQADKVLLRQSVKQKLRQLTVEQMQSESEAIAEQILHSSYYQHATRLGVYLHCAKLREVDTTAIVAAAVQAGTAKQCFVPLVEDKMANMKLLHLDSIEGLVPVLPFNILEPKVTYSDGEPRHDALKMAAPLELLLMPGLAFDSMGHRLGRGGGYYDNFINKCKQRAESQNWQSPLLVALVFQAQLVECVPTAPHDIDIDILVTATETKACSARGEQALADSAIS